MKGIIAILILLIPLAGAEIIYVDSYDYSSEYNEPGVLVQYDQVYDYRYDRLMHKEDVPVYDYCEDHYGVFLECINPFYTKGMRLSKTLHRLGHNYNPEQKKNPYNPYWQLKYPIKVVYS